MPGALVVASGENVNSPGANMSGNDIPFSTRTPQGSTSNDTPLRLRTWFDHTRNMMVVEVVQDTPIASKDESSAK